MGDGNRGHVCPFWIGYFLVSPLRRLLQDPRRIVGPHVKEGMIVLDIGCAMGFFSLPMARMVGPAGRVVCVDRQERMIRVLERRVRRAGLGSRIEPRMCRGDSLEVGDLAGRVDFALAFAVVHEVPDPSALFAQLREVVKPSGRILMAEPRRRVSDKALAISAAAAERSGFTVVDRPLIRGSRAALLAKA